jgi:hypothetical protein
MLGENIDIININKALLVASKTVGLEVYLEEAKYMLMSRSRKTGKECTANISNRYFEEVADFKYLGT